MTILCVGIGTRAGCVYALGVFYCKHMLFGLLHALVCVLVMVGCMDIDGKSAGSLNSCMGHIFVFGGGVYIWVV